MRARDTAKRGYEKSSKKETKEGRWAAKQERKLYILFVESMNILSSITNCKIVCFTIENIWSGSTRFNGNEVCTQHFGYVNEQILQY